MNTRRWTDKVLPRFLVLGTLTLGLIVTGCNNPTANQNIENNIQNYDSPLSRAVTATTSSILPEFQYPFGMPKTGSMTDTDLLAEYNVWKAAYVTSDGAGTGGLRVKRDKSSSDDTVSEGIGYGMLLAVFFDDKATFDGLYKYCKNHMTTVGLMHWKVRADGVNISEFRLKVPHPSVYMLQSDWNKEDQDDTLPGIHRKYYVDKAADLSVTYNNSNPGNQVLNIATCDKVNNETGLIPPDGKPDYLLSAGPRDLSSATDADVDIAASLCLAINRWRSVSDSYLLEAATTIKKILQNDVINGFIRSGNKWGNQESWNPSYFAPAWFKLYKQVILDNKENSTVKRILDPQVTIDKCDEVLTTMYGEMAKIDAANGTAGLFPDWCNTYTATVTKSHASDRGYYLDENGDGAVDDWNNDLNQGTYAVWKPDNKINDKDAYDLHSFNHYYDAVRVPWRLSLDYSWYGDSRAESMTKESGNHFKDIGFTNMKDGYAIDGTPWKQSDKDGFNPAIGGSSYSPSFIAMHATSVLALGDVVYASNCFEEVKNNPENMANSHNYYGNALRLLSLVYLSGKFINYYDLSNFKIVTKPAVTTPIGPLTIDLAYANDYCVYGITQCDIHDRAKIKTSDGTGYAKVGSGITSAAGNDEMMLGWGACTGDVICGLSKLVVRSPSIQGNVIARGTIEGNIVNVAPFVGGVVKNLNKNPGCMDFSITNMTDFKSSPTDEAIKVENGTTATKAPGKYGVVTVTDRGTLNLSSGYYYFYSLDIGTEVKLNLNTTSGPIVICVKDAFNIKNRTAIFGESGKPADASKILFISGSTPMVYISPEVKWKGTLIAPNTGYLNIDIGSKGSAQGAFWGNKTTIHQDTIINFAPLNWAAITSLPIK